MAHFPLGIATWDWWLAGASRHVSWKFWGIIFFFRFCIFQLLSYNTSEGRRLGRFIKISLCCFCFHFPRHKLRKKTEICAKVRVGESWGISYVCFFEFIARHAMIKSSSFRNGWRKSSIESWESEYIKKNVFIQRAKDNGGVHKAEREKRLKSLNNKLAFIRTFIHSQHETKDCRGGESRRNAYTNWVLDSWIV